MIISTREIKMRGWLGMICLNSISPTQLNIISHEIIWPKKYQQRFLEKEIVYVYNFATSLDLYTLRKMSVTYALLFNGWQWLIAISSVRNLNNTRKRQENEVCWESFVSGDRLGLRRIPNRRVPSLPRLLHPKPKTPRYRPHFTTGRWWRGSCLRFVTVSPRWDHRLWELWCLSSLRERMGRVSQCGFRWWHRVERS